MLSRTAPATTGAKRSQVDKEVKLLYYYENQQPEKWEARHVRWHAPHPPKNTRYSPHVRRVNCQGISSAQYMTLPAVNAIPSAREIDSQSED